MMCNSLNKFYSNSKYPIFTLNNLNFEEDDLNNYCFDCGKRYPEYISINNGIFICRKCGMEHMLFPGGSSILIKNDINSLSEKEMEFIKFGGNKKLYEFIYNQCPPLMNLPKQYLYTSPILNSYQNQLLQNVNKNLAKRAKMYNFHINPNYSLKEINCSLKRYNTDLFNFDILNDEKTILKNKIKCKFSDDYYNNFNQKTNNTHANTISNSNTLTYVSERTNENLFNLINTDKKTIEQKSRIILTNPNIVYNKPKISNSFYIMKLDKNKDKNNSNNKNYNNSNTSTLNNNNNYYSNNTIDYDKLTKDSFYIFQTPQKKNTNRFFFNNNKIKSNHNNNSKEKRNKSERKIKEIVINKKMNKLNIYNSESKLWYKTKTYFQKRKPIEENNNNIINYSESKNNENKYRTDLNFNESIINNNNIKTIEINNRYKCRYINVNKKNNFDNFISKNNADLNENRSNNNNNYIIDSNNIEININNNLKKEKQIIININNNNNYNKSENECEKFKNKSKENLNTNEGMDENRTFNHKRNRLSSNFFINKNKLDIKEMKKLYFKNKINNYKENRLNENKSKEKEKKFNNTYISKDNAEHFQIFSNNNTSFKKKENNDYNEEEKNRFRTTLLKRNILNKNKSVINNSCLILNDLEEIKSGETFKYSIRNKYKKEKSLQKIKDL